MSAPLIIGAEALPALAAELRRPATGRVFVLADSDTLSNCYPRLKPHLPEHLLIDFPAGEEYKTLATCEHVWRELTEAHAGRDAVLVALGGGVVTDLGGFAAAVYKRGIRCLLVPTSLLAMADAAVGGKTGVDYLDLKNQLGVFQQPAGVYVDPDFLQTLDVRQLKSGYAEIIKHWLIADADAFYQQRRVGIMTDDWPGVIQQSIAVKERITQLDPLENGPRRQLNFGHTVGHALESYLLSQPSRTVLHGEAVAAGIVCEAWLSVQHGLLPAGDLDMIETLVFSIYEKIPFASLETEAIAQLALHDKKNAGGTIRCVLLEAIGRATIDQPVTVAEIAESLRYYHQL